MTRTVAVLGKLRCHCLIGFWVYLPTRDRFVCRQCGAWWDTATLHMRHVHGAKADHNTANMAAGVNNAQKGGPR